MKRGLLWLLGLGLAIGIGSLRLGEPELRPAPGRKVVLLSASWCSICAEARQFLRGGSVAFDEYDVEKSERGRALYAELGGGGVPILLVDGDVLRGLDRGEWAEALSAPLTPETGSAWRSRPRGAEGAEPRGAAAPRRRARG